MKLSIADSNDDAYDTAMIALSLRTGVGPHMAERNSIEFTTGFQAAVSPHRHCPAVGKVPGDYTTRIPVHEGRQVHETQAIGI